MEINNFGDYILSEMESHMDYYKKLAKKQDEIDLEIEKMTKEIIRASDAGEEISRDGFVEMETLRRVYSIVITEFVKTSSRIAMLFQVIASFGLVKDIEGRKDYNLIKRIVEEFEFMFISDKGGFDLVHVKHIEDSWNPLLGSVGAPGKIGDMVRVAVSAGGPHGLRIQVEGHHHGDSFVIRPSCHFAVPPFCALAGDV